MDQQREAPVTVNIHEVNRLVAELRAGLEPLYRELEKVIVGQRIMVDRLLIGLLTGGHILLEGVPGLAKTLAVRTLAQGLRLSFHRIQFTPDLLPADVIGTQIYNPRTGEFTIKRGPIFANLVLADEINRAPAKVQSALLEAMQEKQVTIGDVSYVLDQPFLVLATQNPIEQEGTYPLPEAQLDRFFYKLLVPYPTKDDLAEVVGRTTGSAEASAETVAHGPDVLRMRHSVRDVPISKDVLDFALSIVVATHPEGDGSADFARRYARYGSSPRGAQSIVTAGKTYALLDGRFNVAKEDVKRAARPALRHRVILNFEAEADGVTTDQLVDEAVRHAESGRKDPVNV